MPEYEFGYDYGGYAPSAGIFGALAGVFMAYYLILMVLGIVSYVFHALSLYTISKRRGIRNPWLAWLPVGNMWILGSISDQYNYVVKGKIRNRRKILIGLMIAVYVLIFLFYVSMIALIVLVVGDPSMTAGIGNVLLLLLVALALIVVSIVAAVYQYIAMYDLFRSCEPDNAVLYLVLSILFGIVCPVFFFVCRKKDLGMPPRKQAPQEIPLAETVMETPVDITEE